MKAIKTFLMLFIMSVSHLAFAGHIKSDVTATSLSDYIQMNCKKTCVDHRSLVEATREAAAKFHVSQRMLIALIKVESNFNRLARNGRNGMSIGLTQVQVYWHRDKFRGKRYTDIHANVMAGAEILGDCLRKKRSAARALVCYNGGGDPVYVAKINKTMKEVSRLDGVES